MTFFVHGLTGHETMPMNRLFAKRLVNKTDEIYAYHGIENRHIDASEESMAGHHHGHRETVSQSYSSIEHESDSGVVTASEIMVSSVEVLAPTAMISEVVALFHKRKFRHVPVISDEKGLIGLVSDRDVLRYLGELSLEDKEHTHTKFNLITEVMTTDVVSASSDTDVRYIARLFVEGRIGAMPVVDDGELTGILTRSDILRAVMKDFHIGLWA